MNFTAFDENFAFKEIDDKFFLVSKAAGKNAKKQEEMIIGIIMSTFAIN